VTSSAACGRSTLDRGKGYNFNTAAMFQAIACDTQTSKQLDARRDVLQSALVAVWWTDRAYGTVRSGCASVAFLAVESKVPLAERIRADADRCSHDEIEQDFLAASARAVSAICRKIYDEEWKRG